MAHYLIQCIKGKKIEVKIIENYNMNLIVSENIISNCLTQNATRQERRKFCSFG